MSQQFRTVTTNAGRNAVREALTQGKTVKLSHMSVGDGGGNPVTPLSTMTKLVNERFRAQINDIVLDPATPDLFTAELFIPQAEGGWYIREVGLWMDDGTLFAVGNTPLTEKPDISSGAATDLLVRLIIRVLDAATVSIEIDPAQVLATREYVDRKLDAHNKDGGAHETLARKSVQIKAGTGLTGGGTLEADRTLTVKYGNTAGTACQGNDVRLADARTPKPHKATHQTGGSDAITPADIGAAAKTIQIKPGTGLSGGGTAAGTACQGNDARLSNARTPKAHKATHKTGGTDALTPADIGAAPASHTSVAATDTVLGHAKASKTTPKAAGTAAVGTETSTFARGDHVHPVQTTVTGNAGTATKLATARTIDGISFDGSATIAHYGTCSTEAATAAKLVACTGFALATGSRITVRFTVTNTAANPTLNVNGTGEKAIRYRNAAVSASYLAANRTYDFVYDGTYYQLVGDVDTNTTYSLATATKDGLMAKADKSKLDGVAAGAEVNQNAFSKIVVGSTTIRADTEIDTLTLVAGTNITLTPDATNDKVTITAKDTTYTNMAGATASAAGKAGLAPAPAAGAQGKYLRGDGTWQTPPNTTYAVATQSANGLMSATDKKSVDYAEALRLSFIGVPRYWRSTTLPVGHVWANGDLALFADWPELKKIYDAGGFAGMLLAYNANSATIAANLGKWRPNAANPTGLYVPNLSEQFFRAWMGGAGREAGGWMADTGRAIQGLVNLEHVAPTQVTGVFSVAPGDQNGYDMSVTSQNYRSTNFTIDSALMWGSDHVGSAFAPEHVLLPMVLYLGIHT